MHSSDLYQKFIILFMFEHNLQQDSGNFILSMIKPDENTDRE